MLIDEHFLLEKLRWVRHALSNVCCVWHTSFGEQRLTENPLSLSFSLSGPLALALSLTLFKNKKHNQFIQVVYNTTNAFDRNWYIDWSMRPIMSSAFTSWISTDMYDYVIRRLIGDPLHASCFFRFCVFWDVVSSGNSLLYELFMLMDWIYVSKSIFLHT